jgi:hypothetical protein
MKIDLERDEVILILRSLHLASSLYPSDCKVGLAGINDVINFLYKVITEDLRKENRELADRPHYIETGEFKNESKTTRP